MQSQLFILRLISACLQHHSACYKKDTPPPSDTTTTTPNTIHDNTDGEPLERKVTQNSRTSVDQLNGPPDLTSSPNQQVPPLEEALANYLLSLLTKYLVQMHIIEERNDQLTVTSSEHGNDALATASSKGDSQTMEYVREVYNTAGKIMNYISASNWPIYYARIKNAVNVLSSINNDNSDFNPPDVRLLSFASLDVAKLHTVLQGILVNINGYINLLISLLLYRVESLFFKYEATRETFIWKNDANCYLEMDRNKTSSICKDLCQR